MTTPPTRSTFLREQMAGVVEDNTARLRHLEAGGSIVLGKHHPAAAILVDALLDQVLEQQLPLCTHLSANVPARIVWSPGMPTLACYMDFLAYAVLSPYPKCDACATPSDAGLHAVAVGVGPITISAALCGPCVRPRRRTRAAGLDDAEAAITRELLRRIEAAS
jgi:hypothetical protein